MSRLVWNHKEGDAESTIGFILDLYRRGNELIAKVGVKNQKALATVKEQPEVSVLVADFTDGQGNRYTQLLKHLGVVEHPVVGGQKPFIRKLSRTQRMSQSKTNAKANATRRLADEPAAEEPKSGAPDSGGKSTKAEPSNAKELTLVLNALGVEFKTSAGDDATEIPVADVYAMVDKLLAPEDPEPESTPEPVDLTAVEGDPAAMSVAASRLKSENESLRRQMANLASEVEADGKARFMDKLNGLAETGRITAAELTELEAQGKAAKWKLSLAPFERLPASSGASMRRVASKGASTEPAAAADEERIKRERAAFSAFSPANRTSN